MMFYSFDLDPMTLVLKLDLDMVKMYLHTKNEVPSYSGSKVYSLNRQTDRQTDIQTHTHTDRQTYADGKHFAMNLETLIFELSVP